MKAILSVDLQYGIGKNGGLLHKSHEDMKHFKSTTIGETVAMGRKTYESLPVRPLSRRRNIIISRTMKHTSDTHIIRSVTDFLDYIYQTNTNNIFIIGGAEIYKQLLSYCDTIYLTRFEQNFDADTFINKELLYPSGSKIIETKTVQEDGLNIVFETIKKKESD